MTTQTTNRPAHYRPRVHTRAVPVEQIEEQARKAPKNTVATQKTVCNSNIHQRYDGTQDLLASSAHQGADDFLTIPSRVGNRLHYRDGRVVDFLSKDEREACARICDNLGIEYQNKERA